MDLWADKQERDLLVKMLKAEGRVTNFEFNVLNKQGEVRRCISSLRLYRDTGILEGSIQDITERKQIEQALMESEERFRVIFEKANDGIAISNENDELLSVNQRFCEMMGYSREELLKMRVSDLQVPEIRRSDGVLKYELERYGTNLFEGLDLHRSGRRIQVEISLGRIELPSGGLYVSVVRDITDRKQAEKKLISSEARLRTVFRAMADVVLIIDQNGIYCEVGPTNPAVWYINPQELLGKSLRDFFPPEQAEYF